MSKFDPAIRDELQKTIEKLPLEAVGRVMEFVETILPSTKPLTLKEIRDEREEILRLGEKHGIYNIAVFGSVARGEADGGSDIDFVADMKEGATAFDLIGFKIEMEKLLGYSVDIVLRKNLKRHVGREVLGESVKL